MTWGEAAGIFAVLIPILALIALAVNALTKPMQWERQLKIHQGKAMEDIEPGP